MVEVPPFTTITGTKGDDRIDAIQSPAGQPKPTDGNELIMALRGNDKVNGLGGDDTILGGRGRDTIGGGAGTDRLDGGKDGDQFVFSAKLKVAAVDTIVNFEHDHDRITLHDKVFKEVGSSISSSEFYAKAGAIKAHDSSDRVIYNKATGDLYYDKDGKGGATAFHFATLANHPGSLDHADFLIV